MTFFNLEASLKKLSTDATPWHRVKRMIYIYFLLGGGMGAWGVGGLGGLLSLLNVVVMSLANLTIL